MLHGTLGVSDREVAAAGARVVASAPAIAHAAPLIGALHEPWQTIPVGARIIAVADAYDTVSAARGHDAALAEIRRPAVRPGRGRRVRGDLPPERRAVHRHLSAYAPVSPERGRVPSAPPISSWLRRGRGGRVRR